MSAGNNNSLTALQQQQQAALTQGGASINKTFNNKFTPQYYAGVTQNYEQQQLPEVFSDYRTTGQNLNYKLADQGLSKSSVSQNLGSSLNSQLAQGEQQVVNNAIGQSQNLQTQVAGEESQLYGQLQSSQNPTLAAQSAANLAAQTGAPSVFAPIGNLFSNWSNLYLANQTSNTANQQNELNLALYSPLLNQQYSGQESIPNYQ